MPNAIKIGNEILVNTATAGPQQEPAIAALSGGRFVVAWTDANPSGADLSQAAVRAQIFNADGSKAGNEFLVNTTTTGAQDDAVIATLADGRFIIGWTDASRGAGDTSGEAVRAQLFNSDGSKSGGEFVVPAATFSHQEQPSIAGLPGGRFIATWTDSSGTGEADVTAIRAQIFNADGTRSGAEFLVNTTTQNGQDHPAVAALADGHIVVTWTDHSATGGDTSNAAIRAQLFNSDGSRLGNEILVNTTTSSHQMDPAVTKLADGHFVIAWTDLSQSGGDTSGPAVRAQIFNGDGAKSGGEFLVNTTTSANQQQPSLAALPDGGFIAAWGDGSGSTLTQFQVRAQIFGSDGSKVGPEFVANTTLESAQWRPVVTALDAGRFAIAWEDQSATGGDTSSNAIRAQIFDTREPPVIAGGESVTMSLSENTSVVTAVSAGDNPVFSYEITGGADASLFRIDAATGVLSFVDSPNFEAPDDFGQDNSYDVTVRVADGALTDEQAITVNVTNANEAPTVTPYPGMRFIVAENGAEIAWIYATDPDAGATKHFSIAGGADAAHFQIDDATGLLSFVAAPDFENPADADQDNIYDVVVRVSDGELFDEKAFTVAVSNAAEQIEPGPRDGSEFIVNDTTTPSSHAEPAIAGFASGQFVAVYVDHGVTGDTHEIRAQVFHADGSKSGNELTIGSVVTQDPEPVVTTLFDGRFVVAWTDLRADGVVGGSVHMQAFNRDGSRAGGEFIAATSIEVDQDGPSITELAEGRFVVTWLDLAEAGNYNTHAIRAQMFNSDATPRGAAFDANTTVNASSHPVVGKFGNGFVAAWTDNSGETDQSLSGIRAHAFDADGNRVGSEFQVNSVTAGEQAQPSIAGLPDGRFVAVWTDESHIGGDTDSTAVHGQIFNRDGTRSGAEFLVNTTTASTQQDAVVTALRDGRFVVTWTDYSASAGDTSASAIRAQIFNRDGSKFGAEFVANTTTEGSQGIPSIAALADGRFAIAWDGEGDAAGIGDNLRAQIFDARDAAVNIKGTPGDDEYLGTAFDDTMRGGGGNDRLDGGAGDDTAIFQNDVGQYSVQVLGDGRLMVSGPEGIDTISSFEHLRFGDTLFDADALHAPQIVSDGGGDAATFSIGEHATAVTTVHATDIDPGTTLTYAIAGGADAGAFVIDSATGALRFAAPPNFATPTDSDHDNSYVVQVRASDGVLIDTQTIMVNVTEVTDTPSFIWLTGTAGDDTFTALPGNERIDALGGNDTVVFDFKLTDAHVTYAGNAVIIDSATSHTVLTGFERYVFADGTVDNNDGDPLVDDLFYYSQNHDVWNAGTDADAHYHAFGWHEGRDPSAFFSTATYLSLYQDVKAAGVDPLEHFHQAGWKESRVPSFAFDGAAYLAANPDVAAAQVDPLAHFLGWGAQEGRQPFALDHLFASNGFDYVYYLQHNPDVAAAQVDPLRHFELYGWREGRNPNAWFDTDGYLSHYADVAAAGINPLTHYDQPGWHEGRDPSAAFDTLGYLAANPDVMASNVNPLLHYLQYGLHEGRTAFPDGVWG